MNLVLGDTFWLPQNSQMQALEVGGKGLASRLQPGAHLGGGLTLHRCLTHTRGSLLENSGAQFPCCLVAPLLGGLLWFVFSSSRLRL